MISKYSLFSKTNLITNIIGLNRINGMFESLNCFNAINTYIGCKYLSFLKVDRIKYFYNDIKSIQMESKRYVELALQFYEGKNVEKNNKKSLYYLILAANKGNVQAHFALGLYYYCGIGMNKNNIHESFKHFKYAAMNRNAKAQYCYGMCLIRGEGIKVNKLKGIRYFRLSADNGYDEAQYLYGRILYEGYEIKENIKEAANYFNKSKQQGNKKANYYYALCMNHKKNVQNTEKFV